MPAEIVFTSVPRGLDGGSGTQPVIRTRDMNSSLAERLKIVSGYSHPFRHGDGRNPVVFFHRIERVAGGTHHVLARLCDAGSDHTGRSNYLGHLLAVDGATTGTKQAGPVAVALQYSFLPKWSGVPEELPPPTIIGCTKADPAPCAAWTAAGLDPGLAGDLAEAAMRGEEVNLITPANQSDAQFVLKLFADALRLVEPGRRWRVTFNTCEIEPFDATWRAIRADLPQVSEMRQRGGRLIDLVAGARGSDGSYAQFARGEAEALPWQPKAFVAGADRNVDSAVAAEPASTAARGARVAPAPGKAPPRFKGPGFEQLAGTSPRRRFKVHEGTKRPEQRRNPWLVALPVTAVVLLALGLAGIAVFKPDWLGPEPKPDVKPTEVAGGGRGGAIPPVGQAAAAATDADYNRRKREKGERAKLENPADGRTVAVIRADVVALQARINGERTGPEPVTLGRGTSDGPDALLERVLAKCRRVQSCLDEEKASEQELTEAQATLRQADADLALAKVRFESLLSDERAEIAATKKREAETRKNRHQDEAFKALSTLATHAVLPPPVNKGDIETPGGPQGNAPIDLGVFPVAHLIEPTFSLAVPRDDYDGKPFDARVSRPDESKPEWLIEFLPHGSEGELDKGSTKPRPLAKLYVLNDRLYVALTEEPNEGRPHALLRRCVLFVSAKRPSGAPAMSGQPSQPPTSDKPHEIRFVKPATVGPLPVDPFGGSKTLEVKPPPGIACRGDGRLLKLPIASCEVRAEFAGHEVRHRLPNASSKDAPSTVIEDHVVLAPFNPKVRLELDIKFSLQEATLRVTPQIHGDGVQPPSLELIKERFLDEPKQKRDRMTQAWRENIKNSPGMKPGLIPSEMKPERLQQWFFTPLVVPQTMGVAMPGHESIQTSLDVFLKHEYREAEEHLKKRRDAGEKRVPDEPAKPKNFQCWYDQDLKAKEPLKTELELKASVAAWKENFQDTVMRWWKWFEPQLVAEWDKVGNAVEQVAKDVAEKKCRIDEIVSLAYDEAGNEYRVPLVVFGRKKQPQAGAGGAPPGDPFDGVK